MGFLIKGLMWTSLKPESLLRQTVGKTNVMLPIPSGTFRYVVAMRHEVHPGVHPRENPGEASLAALGE